MRAVTGQAAAIYRVATVALMLEAMAAGRVKFASVINELCPRLT